MKKNTQTKKHQNKRHNKTKKYQKKTQKEREKKKAKMSRIFFDFISSKKKKREKIH